MSFSLDDIQGCTLQPKFIHRYGDRPYFLTEVNQLASIGVFLKIKISESEYKWARIKSVVDVPPFEWKQKRFRIKFAVEGFQTESLIPCEALSGKAVAHDEVHQYCLAGSNGDEVDYSKLPSSEGARTVKAELEKKIARRPVTESDIAAIEQYASSLEAFPGNIAVKHAVTMIGNLREETELGVSTSFHPTGVSAKAQQRRLGDKDAPESQPSYSQFSQLSDLSQQTIALDAETDRWIEAKKNEELFAQYVSGPDRNAFIELLASKTKENAKQNAAATVRAMSEKKLRESNMIESTGLWITDDKERQRTAAAFAKERSDEGKPKDNEKKPSVTSAHAAVKDSGAAGQDSDVFLRKCLEKRQTLSQDMADAVTDDFLSIETGMVPSSRSVSFLQPDSPPASQLVFHCRRSSEGKRPRE